MGRAQHRVGGGSPLKEGTQNHAKDHKKGVALRVPKNRREDQKMGPKRAKKSWTKKGAIGASIFQHLLFSSIWTD